MKALTNYIPISECQHAHLYIIDARNSHLGIYNKFNQGFILLRTKFKFKYLFTEYHCDYDGCFKTTKPIECIEKTNFRITKYFNDFYSNRKLNKKIFAYLDEKLKNKWYYDRFVLYITEFNDLMKRIYKEELERIEKEHKNGI